jgi:amino acid transporter
MTNNRDVAMNGEKAIGLWSAAAIGIGAMIGAGIFSILGVGGQIAGNALYISFIIGGIVALLSTYSYTKLGVRYPSAGGPAEYLVQGFGDGILSGGFNILLWISYVFGLALYSRAFGEYAKTFLPASAPGLWTNIFAIVVILIFTAINFIGAKAVGRSEKLIVAVKVAILLIFVSVGIFFIKPELLSPALWPGASPILFGAAITYVAYTGFNLITTAAEDMDNPQKTLPRALYLSVIIVMLIYVSVSFTVVGNLPIPALINARDYALAQAAQPFLGTVGFKIVAIAALFSTASGINATLYGGANVTYMLARDGELPSMFERKLWRRGTEGLFITAGLTLLFANVFELGGIAMMSSASILLLTVAVNVAHLRLYKHTGAEKHVLLVTVIANLAFFGALVYYQSRSPAALYTLIIVLILCFIGEWVYRGYSHRTMKTRQ